MQVQSIQSEKGKKDKDREESVGQRRGEYRISGKKVERTVQSPQAPPVVWEA